jgi:hypothetical protein
MNAGGYEGPVIAKYQTVQIACEISNGFRVADGNTYWYKIASDPWNGNYWVSADAFYNNGATSGSLIGTPYVDPAVRDCNAPVPPPPPPPPSPAPSVSLGQGPVAPVGYRYAIGLANFGANARVSITCYDSASPSGYYTFALTTDSNGSASTASYCYSGAGDHWVVAGGIPSNHVTWGNAGSSGGSTSNPVPSPAGGTTSPPNNNAGSTSSSNAGSSTAPKSCAGPLGSGTYDGFGACMWAVNNWDAAPRFLDDCTWFVSQALWEGDLPKSAEWTSASWDPSILAVRDYGSDKGPFAYPGPTKDSAYAPALVDYLVSHGLATEHTIRWSDNTAGGARIGDVIAYSWNNPSDGVIDHVAIVTGFNGTYPLVSQHTERRLNRGWSWDPSAGNWIQYSHPGSVAFLIHITG